MIKKNLTWGAIICFLTLTLISADTPSSRYFQISKNMEILSSVYAEVNRYYVDELEPNRLMKIGIDAMLESLDPYTVYIPEDDIEDFRTISSGEYGGIGAIIGTRKERILVLMPYKGFPAYKAGLKIGDEIVEISGKSTKGKNSNEISKLLKGQAGTELQLKVKRYAQETLINLSLTREKVTIENVPYYGMINDEIGYFKLSKFTRKASENVANAIKELQAEGATKFVFDLRGNGGGLLNEAINIAGLFVPKGSEAVSTRGKVEQWNETFKTRTSPILPDAPIVVLTNGRSASASEIVAGVLQDYDRGVLVGSKSFGKGLVQSVKDISYQSKVKITTAKYYIPSGRCIQAIDYGNRTKDGTAKKLPDSLLTPYKTKAGRLVYDGAGLTPDVKIKKEKPSAILSALISQDLIFDYATTYYYQHDSIGDLKKYKFIEYNDFIHWLKTQDYSYKIPAENSLDKFKADVSKNKLFDFSKEIVAFEEKIKIEKNNDLVEFKKEIIKVIKREIITRYYYQKGLIEATFDDDKDILKAVELLSDIKKYNFLLKKE